MGTTAIGGLVTAQTVTKTLVAGDLTLNAVLATVSVPGDATILDVIFTTTDLDTGASGAIDIGDTDDDNRFVAAFSIQAAGSIRASDSAGLLEGVYTYSTTGEQDIEVTVNAAPATAAGGTITVTVIYVRG